MFLMLSLFQITVSPVSRVLGSHRLPRDSIVAAKRMHTRFHTLSLFHRRSEEGGHQPPSCRDLYTELQIELTEEGSLGLGNLSSRHSTSQSSIGVEGPGIPFTFLHLLTIPQKVVHSTLPLFIQVHQHQAFCHHLQLTPQHQQHHIHQASSPLPLHPPSR